MQIQSNFTTLHSFTNMMTSLALSTDKQVKDVRSACLILSAVWYNIDVSAVDADTRNLVRMDLNNIAMTPNSKNARELFDCLVRTFVFIGDTRNIKCIRTIDKSLSMY